MVNVRVATETLMRRCAMEHLIPAMYRVSAGTKSWPHARLGVRDAASAPIGRASHGLCRNGCEVPRRRWQWKLKLLGFV